MSHLRAFCTHYSTFTNCVKHAKENYANMS
jgi:hypothetical protein